jgi:hypothetical protein
MKESKLYNIYEGLPSYARGVVVVGLLALTYIVGKTILDAIEAAAAAKKSAERQKQFQDELNDTNSKSLDEFNKLALELKSFHSLNIEYLKQQTVDDQIVKN